MSTGEDSQGHRRRLVRSTAIFGFATGVSRVLGLVREIVAAYYFGSVGKINAFTVAYQVPNLIRALVADAALSSAFVPVFTELLEKGDRKRAWRVASSVFFLMLLGLGALTALCIVFAPLLIRPFGDPGGDEQLAVTLTRILFPTVVLLGVSGVIVGILNSYDEFTVPALAPIAWNIAIIVGLVIGVPSASSLDAKLYVYAVSILIGTVIQVLLPVPWLRGLDGRLRVALDWRDPAVKQVFVLMLPVTLGLGLINFNAVVDTLFASRLIDPEQAPRAIDLAFRLYMLPQGIFSVAVATILFPTLARLAARGDMDGFRRTSAIGLRQIGFLLIPASAALAALATPIVRVVYQHGAFTPDQTAVVAQCLAAFSLGLAFNGAMLMLNRSFFSLQSPWVPTAVALLNLGLNAVFDWAFYRLGTWGIPLATSVVNIAGTVALMQFLRMRIGRIELTETIHSTARVLVASAALAVVAHEVWAALDSLLGRGTGAQIVSLVGAFGAGLATYLGVCLLLGVRELNPLHSIGGDDR
jgi:putative peptidoglycan lipid II flippase